MVKGKVSLVAFGFRSSGDPMIKAFSMHWEDVFGMHNNKKRLFGAIFTLKVHVILPRQARDQHRERRRKKKVSCAGADSRTQFLEVNMQASAAQVIDPFDQYIMLG